MANENVLVVEDEEMMRGILRQLIEGAGYNVFTADSAETAVEIFSVNEIVITLTDIKMSGRDGLQLLDQIKSVDEDAIVIENCPHKKGLLKTYPLFPLPNC